MILSHFHSIRPPHETAQGETLQWLVAAHTQSEKSKGMNGKDLEEFAKTFEEKLWHVGAKPDKIKKRGHILKDVLHQNWSEMEIYNLIESASGKNLSSRSKYFEEFVDQVFEQYYPEASLPPEDLIHTTCTGYVSPSGAQKIVSKRNWGALTTVTHAYHMGCYASLPAIRIGTGFVHSGKKTVDIIHTEVCSLHSNPSLHQIDQLVCQSLFADGFIKYSLSEKRSILPHLKVIAMLEEIIPNSTQSMTWTVSNWGFQMTLAKELPVLIARSLKGYLQRLCDKAGVSLQSILKEAFFAIHPGGPKILTYIQELLSSSEEQMSYSFQILKNFGNMSSATLPHIWQAILDDESVQKTKIVSLAFGPGLTISGAIMEKVCGP